MRNPQFYVFGKRPIVWTGIANPRVAEKTFPALLAHAQPAILRIWQEAHCVDLKLRLVAYSQLRVHFSQEALLCDALSHWMGPYQIDPCIWNDNRRFKALRIECNKTNWKVNSHHDLENVKSNKLTSKIVCNIYRHHFMFEVTGCVGGVWMFKSSPMNRKYLADNL